MSKMAWALCFGDTRKLPRVSRLLTLDAPVKRDGSDGRNSAICAAGFFTSLFSSLNTLIIFCNANSSPSLRVSVSFRAQVPDFCPRRAFNKLWHREVTVCLCFRYNLVLKSVKGRKML